MHIVLLEPEIPHNTGAIGRTCKVTGSALHLIKPLGFSVGEKYLKRSGLDYWHELDVRYHDSFTDFLADENPARLLLATTKASKTYTEIGYGMNDYIMFGRESGGIPEDILAARYNDCIRIPMEPGSRSLNLSVSVGVILYEALRQNNFFNLVKSAQNPCKFTKST